MAASLIDVGICRNLVTAGSSSFKKRRIVDGSDGQQPPPLPARPQGRPQRLRHRIGRATHHL